MDYSDSIEKSLHTKEGTLAIMDEYYNSQARYLILRCFGINYNGTALLVRLVIERFETDWKFSTLSPTAIKDSWRKMRHPFDFDNPNYPPEEALTKNEKKFYEFFEYFKQELFASDAKDLSCDSAFAFKFSTPYRFQAQLSDDRSGFGFDKKYGEGTDFYIVGAILGNGKI